MAIIRFCLLSALIGLNPTLWAQDQDAIQAADQDTILATDQVTAQRAQEAQVVQDDETPTTEYANKYGTACDDSFKDYAESQVLKSLYDEVTKTNASITNVKIGRLASYRRDFSLFKIKFVIEYALNTEDSKQQIHREFSVTSNTPGTESCTFEEETVVGPSTQNLLILK